MQAVVLVEVQFWTIDRSHRAPLRGGLHHPQHSIGKRVESHLLNLLGREIWILILLGLWLRLVQIQLLTEPLVVEHGIVDSGAASSALSVISVSPKRRFIGSLGLIPSQVGVGLAQQAGLLTLIPWQSMNWEGVMVELLRRPFARVATEPFLYNFVVNCFAVTTCSV